MAALDSWNIFSAAEGANPDTFLMGGLRDVTHTPTYILLGAGLVMVLTLCFSKKAHTVIRTSINLSSSSRGGKEQFGSSLPARMLVRGATTSFTRSSRRASSAFSTSVSSSPSIRRATSPSTKCARA